MTSSSFAVVVPVLLAAVTSTCLLFTDLPRVLSMPVRMYLPRGMLGRIDCPVDANPPATLIMWAKNDRIIDAPSTSRLRVNKHGQLIIKSVISEDEGRYSCTPYSPLGAGQMSMPVQVLVRGKTLLGPYRRAGVHFSLTIGMPDNIMLKLKLSFSFYRSNQIWVKLYKISADDSYFVPKRKMKNWVKMNYENYSRFMKPEVRKPRGVVSGARLMFRFYGVDSQVRMKAFCSTSHGARTWRVQAHVIPAVYALRVGICDVRVRPVRLTVMSLSADVADVSTIGHSLRAAAKQICLKI